MAFKGLWKNSYKFLKKRGLSGSFLDFSAHCLKVPGLLFSPLPKWKNSTAVPLWDQTPECNYYSPNLAANSFFFYAIRKSYWKPKQGLTYSSGSATATTSTPSSTELCPHPMPQRGGIFHPSHSRCVSGTKITTLSAVSLLHGARPNSSLDHHFQF